MNSCLLVPSTPGCAMPKTIVDSNGPRGLSRQCRNIKRSERQTSIHELSLAPSPRLAALLVAAVALLSFNAVAQMPTSVTLAWSPSSANDIVGYTVYYGVASSTYTNKV